MKLKVAISAGEPSGDEHLGRVIAALRGASSCEIRGMAGRNSRAAGAEIIVDCEKSGSLMGFSEVLLSAREVYRTWRAMSDLLVKWRPDILVLVDYADFNLRLARRAHSLGIKVLYYITPQLWAWRAGRAKKFNAYVDRAAVIFPFERAFFEAHGYDRAVFVGHPFIDTLQGESLRSEALTPSRAETAEREKLEFCTSASLDPSEKIFAFFPGSRKSEIVRLLPRVIEAAKILKSRVPNVQVVLAVSPAVAASVRAGTQSVPALKLIEGRSLDVLKYADAALLKSGTSNLQAAFLGTPFSMFFVVPWLTQVIVQTFVHITQYSIVNVIRPGSVRELIQGKATAEMLAREAEDLLLDASKREKLLANMSEVRSRLKSFDPLPLFSGCASESERTARLILETATQAPVKV